MRTYYSYNEPFKDGERYAGGGGVRLREHVNYGALRAIDPTTGDRKWEFRYPNVSSSGVLTTASGLVFAGDGDGNVMAFESKTGKNLWHYQLGVMLRSTGGTTYMVDGKQVLPRALGQHADGVCAAVGTHLHHNLKRATAHPVE